MSSFIERAVDRAVAVFSPSSALERASARRNLEALDEEPRDDLDDGRSYEGSEGGRRTAGWYAPQTSAVASMRGSLGTLRARSRQLVRDNAWASKAVRSITSNTIGGQGLVPQPITDDEDERKRVLDLWEEWAGSTQCDATGDLDFAGLQALVMRETVEAGEVLVRRRPRQGTDPLAVPLQLQVLESDHLDDEFEREVLNQPRNRIVQGVEFNALGRRIAYHVHPEHPGDTFFGAGAFETVRVRARDLAHVFRKDRAGQVRGVPWGASALLRLKDWDAAMDSETQRLVISSSFVAFVHDLNADAMTDPMGEVVNQSGAQDPDVGSRQQFEPGTLQYLPNGKTITFGKPEAFEALVDYAKLTLREIAAAYGTPYEELSGDLEGVNFSSGRMGRLGFAREIQAWQRCLIGKGFLDRVWDWWMVAAVLSGKLPRPLRVEWQSPGQAFLDPKAETEAARSQVQAGFRSLSSVIRERGGNPRRVLAELARDRQVVEELGLVLNAFPDQATSAGQAPAGPSPRSNGSASSNGSSGSRAGSGRRL